MATIPACDVLPGMVIRTALVPERSSEPTAVATFRVASVDGCDGTIRIHADSLSRQIFELPECVQVQVLKWPSYAHEAVDLDPEVRQSWHEDSGLDAGREAPRKAMAEDDGTRVPLDAGLMVRLANTGVPLGEVDRYFRDAAAKMTFKRGGVL